jgi:hypothetical protein
MKNEKKKKRDQVKELHHEELRHDFALLELEA